MSVRDRRELERRVQDLDRVHPDWPASRFESELQRIVPVVHGNWTDDTPNAGARLRQIQRWRRGYRNPAKRKLERPLFRYLWPVGEKQRQGLDPAFAPRPTALRASHRLFLHNFSDEPVREVRAVMDGREVDFEPSIPPAGCRELHWSKNESILHGALDASVGQRISHRLVVDFAVARGTRRARLEGRLWMDTSDGWVSFETPDGTVKEIE